jgi:predicted nucleotidyltransferase
VTADDAQIDEILSRIAAWARSRADILGLALVGSWARGTARYDSDIDLVILVSEPEKFRADVHWLAEIEWTDRDITAWHDAQYGSAWSRHVELWPDREIELTFCAPSWAATNPIDPGTIQVVSGGCRILVDKAELLKNLMAALL